MRTTFKNLCHITTILRTRSGLNYQAFSESGACFVGIKNEDTSIGEIIVRGTTYECYIAVNAVIASIRNAYEPPTSEPKPATNAEALRTALKKLVDVTQALPQPATHDGIELSQALAYARAALYSHTEPQTDTTGPQFIAVISGGILQSVISLTGKPISYLLIDEDAILIQAEEGGLELVGNLTDNEILKGEVIKGLEEGEFTQQSSLTLSNRTASTITNALGYNLPNNPAR